MKCPRCRHENPPQAKFCEECATPLARTCSNCGTVLSATAKFCPSCAHPVVAGAVTRSPDSYTPSTSPEKILTSKSALELESACYSVLRMQDCVKRSAEEVPRSNAAVVKVSVGRGCRARQRQRLHTDDTVVGRHVGV